MLISKIIPFWNKETLMLHRVHSLVKLERDFDCFHSSSKLLLFCWARKSNPLSTAVFVTWYIAEKILQNGSFNHLLIDLLTILQRAQKSFVCVNMTIAQIHNRKDGNSGSFLSICWPRNLLESIKRLGNTSYNYCFMSITNFLFWQLSGFHYLVHIHLYFRFEKIVQFYLFVCKILSYEFIKRFSLLFLASSVCRSAALSFLLEKNCSSVEQASSCSVPIHDCWILVSGLA